MAALFGVDAFAGGPVVNALMSLWLLERFGISLAPRRLAAALSPTLSGALFAAGCVSLPLIGCGVRRAFALVNRQRAGVNTPRVNAKRV